MCGEKVPQVCIRSAYCFLFVRHLFSFFISWLEETRMFPQVRFKTRCRICVSNFATRPTWGGLPLLLLHLYKRARYKGNCKTLHFLLHRPCFYACFWSVTSEKHAKNSRSANSMAGSGYRNRLMVETKIFFSLINEKISLTLTNPNLPTSFMLPWWLLVLFPVCSFYIFYI